MAGGLAALLDDIAAMAKLAAASVDDVGAATGRASAKAAGVVVDDTAVTPRYVQGFSPDRELPVVKRIAVGSLRNKLLFIVPLALLFSQFTPWLLTPLLMLGGCYLCYEGAEKLWEHLTHRGDQQADTEAGSGSTDSDTPEGIDTPEGSRATSTPTAAIGTEQEEAMVTGAIRTDLVLSAEIIVIALGEVATEPLLSRAVILVVVAFLITALVYGVVALIVKMDDVGLALSARGSGFARSIGRALVRAMPRVLTVLSVLGIIAMFWVGGHILLVGTDTLGWSLLYGGVHHAQEAVRAATGLVGPVLAWLTNTFFSALLGLVVGALLVAVGHLIPQWRTS